MTTGTTMIARKSLWRERGFRIPKLLTAISATAAAMSEWKNDCTTHMPGNELKNPESAIANASRRPAALDPQQALCLSYADEGREFHPKRRAEKGASPPLD